MDVRDSTNPVVVSAARWLDRLNARHPWSHNEHFHSWILHNLPERRRLVIDVGCGEGVLTRKLASHFAHVIGIDADAGMAAAASARLADEPRASVRQCRFDAFAATAGERSDSGNGNGNGNDEADLITMVAVLHHLDLDDTLSRIPRLLAPGGRLLVVGLATVSSPADMMIDLVSAVANPVVGLIKHPRPARRLDDEALPDRPVMPMRDPSATVSQIAAAAGVHLPGAKIRRRLFFRYTLRWDKPGGE